MKTSAGYTKIRVTVSTISDLWIEKIIEMWV